MSADESRPSSSRRPRAVEKKVLPTGPARDLRDAVYRLYAEADRPQLAELAQQIAKDNEDDFPGSPGKDLIGKIISGDGLASQHDAVTVAVALARAAGRRNTVPIADQVRRLWIAAATAEPPPPAQRLGRPVNDCDPLALEVHRAIQIPDVSAPVDPLPRYVPRSHDLLLREVADQVLGDGSSRLVTLVGGSSTGKTRACWELARYLDQRQPGRWRVWHPYDPTRPQAAVADLKQVGPQTVMWLNEAQHYLMPTDPALGERLAAGLRTLLQDSGRAPVLVLATLWPQHWDTLTVRPGTGQPDPHAQARELVVGTAVPIADTFTPEQVAGLAAAGADARLRYAAVHVEDGRITQYLAGAPELQTRYRTVDPAARALIQVAMDARRLGHPLAIARTLLERAAPGYLDDHDWDGLGADWLEQALADTARPCKGARGPLTRIRSRPGGHTPDGGQYYRLADYLEQAGRTERAGVYPPDSLWHAFAITVTDPDLLRTLGDQAERRGRYEHAIWLYRRAADRGDTHALRRLAARREKAGDAAGAEVLYRQAADHGDTHALRQLAARWERSGETNRAEALATLAADQGDTHALQTLAWRREQAGDTTGAEALAVRAADHGDAFALRMLAVLQEQNGDPVRAEILFRRAADYGDTFALQALAARREQAGNTRDAEALAMRAADHGDTFALQTLAGLRERAGDTTGAEILYRQAADRGDTFALRQLARLREGAGDTIGAEILYRQATDRGDTLAPWELARLKERAGDTTGAEILYRQAIEQGDTFALRQLARLREQDGDSAGAEVLYRRAADHGDTHALRQLAARRERAGDTTGAETLAVRAADHGDTNALQELARLRERAGDTTSAEILYHRAADHGDTFALQQLARLRERAGDTTTAEALYRRATDHGDTRALQQLARLRERAGDTAAAERVRRFGLTGAGVIAHPFDFESPPPGIA
ncbi:tetratricopeptide repeat protein [Actinoplanes subglobosus]|uniref:Tetratricopeptide repeat protein n=1 Tax=Actinoplanes subglobosus TaxID=1547892 RepID=A0ABV8IHP3_9ACTN